MPKIQNSQKNTGNIFFIYKCIIVKKTKKNLPLELQYDEPNLQNYYDLLQIMC